MHRLTKVCALGLTFVLLNSCKTRHNSESEVEDLRYDGGTPGYIYNGPLPKFRDVRIIVSLKANTVRIIGTPEQPIPASADHVLAMGDGRYTVAYPIASAAEARQNPRVGEQKPIERLFPRRSYSVLRGEKSNQFGLPFIGYAVSGMVAFHSPITTSKDKDDGSTLLTLIRGDISHGCNRMNGEHVVEMAHIIGVDMKSYYKGNELLSKEKLKEINDNVKSIIVTKEFDVLEGLVGEQSHLDGKLVDVDYKPGRGVVLPPQSNTFKFKVWDARTEQIKNRICTYKTRQGAEECAKKPVSQ